MPDGDVPDYDPLRPVDARRRVLGTRDAFALWFSLGIGLLVLQTGALLVPGLGPVAAIGAVAAGTAIGVGLLAGAGIVGVDTGLSSMGTLRPALGIRGAILAAALNALQLLGWGAFEVIAMRDAGAALETHWTGQAHPALLTLLFGAVSTAMAALGPLSGLRRFLRTYGFFLVLAAALLFTALLVSDPHLPSVLGRRGDGSLSFGAGVDLIVALPISWLPLIADYTRFGRTSGAMGRGAFAGNALGNAWFCAMGAGFAFLAGGDALLLPRMAAALLGLPLLLILVDETENAFADIHSAAVSTGLFAGRRFGVGAWSIAIGALATLLAPRPAARALSELPRPARLGVRAAVRHPARRPLPAPAPAGRPARARPRRRRLLVHRRLARRRAPRLGRRDRDLSMDQRRPPRMGRDHPGLPARSTAARGPRPRGAPALGSGMDGGMNGRYDGGRGPGRMFSSMRGRAPALAGRAARLTIWGLVHFAFGLAEQLAELLAPLLLVIGIGWWALPRVLGMIQISDGQMRDIMDGLADRIPAEATIAGHVLTPSGLVIDGVLLMAIAAALSTASALLAKELYRR